MPKDDAPTEADPRDAPQRTDQELLKEDEELFKPTPELLGVGASAPDTDQDPLLKQRSGANYDRLLEQLLGKKAARGHRATSKPQPTQTKPISQKNASNQVDADEDDDEESRATMVASNSALKRKGPSRSTIRNTGTTSQDQKKTEPSSDDDADTRPSKKRSGTYLDQLLAEKASKKKRKQQQKG
ncbi:unnamed protein product [Aureobasidium vineae]|uniref:Uncharacterized protein n=1 Tax=Aureobasidium vineae TaxID=2773715 RepID=A0A9N8JWJ3_9PEZI|nr:unnamed protein product [Aureobasidium vineae]